MSRIIATSEDFYILAAIPEAAEVYSFYLYKEHYENGADIERLLKLDQRTAFFHVEEPGEYRVKGFVESADGKKESFWSDLVCIGQARDDADVRSGDENDPADHRARRLTAGDLEFLGCPAHIATSIQALTILRDAGLDVESLFAAIAELPMPRAVEWFTEVNSNSTAQEVMAHGWEFKNFPSIKLDRYTEWGKPATTNRSWAYQLHAWKFIDPVLRDYLEDQNGEILHWMIEMALSWWSYASDDRDPTSMVWYDMSTSMRMVRLARLVIVCVKAGKTLEAVRLIAILLEHVNFAFEDAFFNPNNNHGFYSAAASIDIAHTFTMLPQSSALEELGQERMRTMVARQFAKDGGHLEHSSEYHRMLLKTFEIALQDGIITDTDVAERVRRAADVLGWMIQPNGHLVQFGDSPDVELVGKGRSSVSENTQFILSGGEQGVPANNELFLLPESGYAFVRSPLAKDAQQLRDGSYLAFLACFHSRAHKHADDLSFTWYDRGHEIVVDSGRYGYGELLPADSPDRDKGFYYGAPERQYIESTIAHNTVTLDGKDIERKDRPPYGSALGACTKIDERFVLRGHVDHVQYSHSRMLRFEPSKRLEIIDTVLPTGDEVELISWFNLDGSLTVTTDGQVIVAELPGGTSTLHVFASDNEVDLVSPVKGQSDPLRGWRSRKDRELEPIWNFGFKWAASSRRRLAVTFQFQDGETS